MKTGTWAGFSAVEEAAHRDMDSNPSTPANNSNYRTTGFVGFSSFSRASHRLPSRHPHDSDEEEVAQKSLLGLTRQIE
jgi:hypothetical protein